MERYEILKDIGSGNFGVARLVRDRITGELYAVKFIERGNKVGPLSFKSLFFPFFSPSDLSIFFEFFWVLGSEF